MSQREIKSHISEQAHESLPQLQERYKCGSQSELIDYLILSQTRSDREARAILAARSKRGNPRRKAISE